MIMTVTVLLMITVLGVKKMVTIVDDPRTVGTTLIGRRDVGT